jgi:tetratricopeptide (TPR) repeat protein
MSVDLYEHYKEALRRGHMAVAHGELDAALEAYREALALAPDRALPYASIGRVLLRQGAAADALASFDDALARAPRDETGLRGRGESLARLGHRTDAAESLDVLSEVQEAAGRIADACDSTRRALDLAEQKARRRRMQDLTRRLRLATGERAAEDDLARMLRPLGPDAAKAPDSDAPATDDAVALGADAAVEIAAMSATADPDLDSAMATADEAIADAESAPEPEPDVDPIALTAEAEVLLDAGDQAGALGRYLAAAVAFETEGLIAAAVDACYVALAFAPDDAEVHLRLVELYLAAGWNGPAADKLALLGRLTELDNRQGHARARIVGLAADHFPDDPRLQRLTAAH